LVEFREVDLGYPQGKNEIIPPDGSLDTGRFSAETGIPSTSAVCDFYRLCDGVTLSDVHVGLFIHRAERVMRAMHDGEPTRIEGGPLTAPIAVIGSDGGGGRFAIRTDDAAEVLYLPTGAVHDQVFDGSSSTVRVVADDFLSFLDRLYQDLVAFVKDDQDWRYIV